MSWTLVRHKNGLEVPIKVSVLDAFTSGSKKSGKSAEASGREKPRANTKAQVTPKVEKGQKGATTNGNSHSTSPPEEWTDEDDKLLLQMKNSNQGWKPILVALGDGHNSESQAKAHYKEIQGKPIGGVAAGGDDEEKKKQAEEKKAIGEKKKAENMAKQAEGKGGKKGKKSNLKSNKSKSATSAPSATSQEKDLKALATKYDENKWLAVASRHFDRTGQRISPEMAKEMCGSKD